MSGSRDKIQLFVPTYDIDGCLAEIRECLELGWTGLGFKTVRFEEEWKKFTGLPFAHFISSNTVGLDLAFRILKQEHGWKDGDEVVTTPLTFVSTNHAILYSNLKPVFADIDDTLCLDPQSVLSRITPRTRAVIYVGMGGNTGALSAIAEICQSRGLRLILDAAHMSGSRYRGHHVGKGIDCTVFSFQAVKNLPIGDAGMICFAEAELDSKARKWSWLGISLDTFARAGEAKGGNYKWLYDVEYLGLKANGNSIMAGIGLAQLKRLEQDNERRRAIAKLYESQLHGADRIRLIPMAPDCESARHLFQLRVPADKRDSLVTYLNENGIFPGVHYRINTDYLMYRYAQGTCQNAELASRELISLPLHLRMTDDDVKRVAETVKEFFNHS